MSADPKVFEQFCEENPQYADAKSAERQVGDKLYRQKFHDAVQDGVLEYRSALDQVKDEVERQLALQEVGTLRSNRTVGTAPSFYRGEAQEERRGGISAGRPGMYGG